MNISISDLSGTDPSFARCGRNEMTKASRWICVRDTLAGGRKFRVLNIVDDFNPRESDDRSRHLTTWKARGAVLEWLCEARGLPDEIVSDHGFAFTGRARRRGPPSPVNHRGPPNSTTARAIKLNCAVTGDIYESVNRCTSRA